MLLIGARRPRRSLTRAALALLGVTATALATAAVPSPATPSAAADAPAEPTSAPRQTAHIVLIGEVGSDPELAPLLRELLERQGIDAALERASRFDQQALFDAPERGTLGIFIALRSPHEARLYFRAPGGERYLVRKLTLPSGLDAVGRELVGQVVASSAEALSFSTEGLSWEQASAEIAGEAAMDPDPAPERAVAPAAASREKDSTPATEGTPATSEGKLWEILMLGRYSVVWTGQNFGARHALGLSAGARFGQSAFVGLALGANYVFEHSFESASLAGHLKAVRFPGLVELGTRVSRSSTLTFALGPELELSELTPERKGTAVTQVIGPHTRARWGLRLEAGCQWSTPEDLGVVLGVSAVADVAFVQTHYDLVRADGTVATVASLWPVRPGVMLTVGARRAH